MSCSYSCVKPLKRLHNKWRPRTMSGPLKRSSWRKRTCNFHHLQRKTHVTAANRNDTIRKHVVNKHGSRKPYTQKQLCNQLQETKKSKHYKEPSITTHTQKQRRNVFRSKFKKKWVTPQPARKNINWSNLQK